MMISKSMGILLEQHHTLGEIFVIRVNNNDGSFFDIKTATETIDKGQLTIRISKMTALKLAQYVDEMTDGDEKNVMVITL